MISLIAIITGIIAAVLFAVDGSRTKSLIAWGLCFLAVTVTLLVFFVSDGTLEVGA